MKKPFIELNLENLLKHFKKTKENAVLQTETDQILITVKFDKVEFPLFVRITETQDLLQLLAFFPCNIKAGCESDMARTLHLLNKELDIPGFGMDDFNGLVFYRCMIPCPDLHYHEAVIDKYLDAVKMICQSFLPLIFAMSQGNMKFSEISNKLGDLMQTADK